MLRNYQTQRRNQELLCVWIYARSMLFNVGVLRVAWDDRRNRKVSAAGGVKRMSTFNFCERQILNCLIQNMRPKIL